MFANVERITVAGTALSLLSVLLILLSTFSPSWFRYFGNNDGLFYTCNAQSKCFVYPASFFPLVNIISLALMLLAVALVLPGIILAFTGIKKNRKHLHISGGLIITGAILTLVAVAVYTGLSSTLLNLIPLAQTLLGPTIQLYGYGYWSAWVGGLFGTIGGALNVHASKKEV